MSHDRYEVLANLDEYLKSSLDLIVVQLGENVANQSTLETDFEEFCNYVIRKCPKAEMVVLGNFGEFAKNAEIDRVKTSVCEKLNIKFVSLEDLKGVEYQLGEGAVVQGDDGMPHTSNHPGVAWHPNDIAHRIIAEKIRFILHQVFSN